MPRFNVTVEVYSSSASWKAGEKPLMTQAVGEIEACDKWAMHDPAMYAFFRIKDKDPEFKGLVGQFVHFVTKELPCG
jgi:hypothetical protein